MTRTDNNANDKKLFSEQSYDHKQNIRHQFFDYEFDALLPEEPVLDADWHCDFNLFGTVNTFQHSYTLHIIATN